MKSYIKYVTLILISFIASIVIYKYVYAWTDVDKKEDILSYQNNKEEKFLKKTAYNAKDPKIIVNPYGNSPLSALIIFETNDLTTPTITIKGEDENDIVQTFVPNKTHILPVYGLYADKNNTVILNVNDTDYELKIKTDKLPEDFPSVKKVTKTKNDSFYFTTFDDNKYAAAYDSYGKVRWYLDGNYSWNIDRLNNGHLLISTDDLIAAPYFNSGLYEMDLLGKVYYEYDINGGYSHEAFEMPNGNLLIISNNFNNNTAEDYIIEIDRSTGDIIKDFDLSKLLENDGNYDWFKANSIAYNNKTNSISVSGENSDMILNLDYSSGEINYIVSNNKIDNYNLNTNIKIKNTESLSIVDNQLLFSTSKDNHKTIYLAKKEKKDFNVKWSYDLEDNDEPVSIDYIDKNNYLISQDKNIFELLNNNNIFSIELDNKIYSSKKMPLYSNDMYSKGKGKRIGTNGITETVKNSIVLLSKYDKNIIKEHNIKFTKEATRLVVTGDFTKDDDVEIILDNFLSKKSYKLIVSNTPFDNETGEETITASKYINNENINGKYYIYLKINGKIYKTYKCIEF